MSRRTYAVLAIVSLLGLSLCVVVANNFYWGVSATNPRGEYYFFKEALPEVVGQLLWLTVKPLLLVSGVATFYFLYRYFRALTKVRPGFCPRCGYDVRATPERCPECGADIAGAAAR